MIDDPLQGSGNPKVIYHIEIIEHLRCADYSWAVMAAP
jgi:hypothetical protein